MLLSLDSGMKHSGDEKLIIIISVAVRGISYYSLFFSFNTVEVKTLLPNLKNGCRLI